MGDTRFPGLAVAVCLAVAIAGLSVLGCFALPDGLAYDLVSRLVASQIQSPSKVVLIQGNYDLRLADDLIWLRFLRLVEDMGAEQVIFTFQPSWLPAATFVAPVPTGSRSNATVPLAALLML